MASLMDGDRYSRIAQMPWIGADGLAKLQRSSVAILGVGNVGGQLCTHFGLMGCHLTLVDRDVVSRPNLGTQGFAAREDVGRSKVEARARALRASNDRCSVTAIEADIEFVGRQVRRGKAPPATRRLCNKVYRRRESRLDDRERETGAPHNR